MYYKGAGLEWEIAQLKAVVTKTLPWSPSARLSRATAEELRAMYTKETPLGLPAPEPPEDWTEPELTPPYGQPLNCYLCGGVTRMTRWDMPICTSCDKLCRRDHANGRT